MAIKLGYQIVPCACVGIECHTDAPELLAKMRTAVEAGDADGLRQTAHSLKSSSANLGALEFAQHCKELEMLGKSGELAGSAEWLAPMQDMLARVMGALEQARNKKVA